MKIKAMHKSLINLYELANLELITTNQYDDIKKEHLLTTRKGDNKLVNFDTLPSGYRGHLTSYQIIEDKLKFFNEFLASTPHGPAVNGNFYTITKAGLEKVAELKPEHKEDIDIILADFAKRLLADEMTDYEMVIREL